ncbi:hypothetical protein BLNAU_13740 [Blattamonas nauphoetae]|uniref:Uncharacterized protein n=1 Tax=Blattamonas nauphoetae TaxID=2049346 RepID=A0ABQ9XH69_9EUKA|nr:hypothetical protein BLNAU_13740 [Blattamonas nauphoetae]
MIPTSFRLTTPNVLRQLAIEDHDEPKNVHETVLQQVLVTSEQYICHLCVNRYSIIDGTLSNRFLSLLAQLLERSPYYHPTMDFVLQMPVCLTIPSCLTFFENNETIHYFLVLMNNFQWEWYIQDEDVRRTGTLLLRSLRMEGFEDEMEQILRSNSEGDYGRWIAPCSIGWNNLQGMNLQEQE